MVVRMIVLAVAALTGAGCCLCTEPDQEPSDLTLAARQFALTPQAVISNWSRVDIDSYLLERYDPELTLAFGDDGLDPKQFDGMVRAYWGTFHGIGLATGTFKAKDVTVFVDERDRGTSAKRGEFREWRSRSGSVLLAKDGLFYQAAEADVEAALEVRAGKRPSVLDLPGVAEILARTGECDAVSVMRVPRDEEEPRAEPAAGLVSAVVVAWAGDEKIPLHGTVYLQYDSPESAIRDESRVRSTLSEKAPARVIKPDSVRVEGHRIIFDYERLWRFSSILIWGD